MDRLAFYAKTSPTLPIDKQGKQPNPHAKQIYQHIASSATTTVPKEKSFITPKCNKNGPQSIIIHEPFKVQGGKDDSTYVNPFILVSPNVIHVTN